MRHFASPRHPSLHLKGLGEPSATAKRRPDIAPANRGSFSSVTGSSRDVSLGEGAVLAGRERLVVMSVNVIPEGLDELTRVR